MRPRRPRSAAGLAAALAIAAAGCAGAAPRVPPAASGPATGPPSPPAARAPACRAAELKIAMVKSGVAAGHVGATIGFANTGGAPCALTGWPRVVASTGTGAAVTAGRVLSTFFGPAGLAAPPVVAIAPGRRAEAQIAGLDFPLHGATCPPSYRRLRITPPGAARASEISAWVAGLGRYLPACGPITVSPVVPPSKLP